MFSGKLTRSVAAGAAAVALAIGAYAVGNSTSSSSATSRTATSAPAAQSAQASGGGQVPQGWSPGSGTIITGATADQAKAAAVAKYPEGTVNRVLQLSDGSYAVHRIATPAPHHIFVSKDFTVTGTA
jgi:type IV secretory pathway TrbL component